eukprot:5112758-Amphidinium_carterae.1
MEFPVTGTLEVTADALLQGVRHSLARLRNQVHLRNTLVYQSAVDAKELAPVLTRSCRVGKTQSDHVFSVGLRNTLSLAWFLNPDARSGFLADPEFRTMCRLRLSLPVHADGARCHYIRNGSSLACRELVTDSGSHAQHCCRRLIIARHGRLCSMLAHLCRLAGWSVIREQNVASGPGAQNRSCGCVTTHGDGVSTCARPPPLPPPSLAPPTELRFAENGSQIREHTQVRNAMDAACASLALAANAPAGGIVHEH